MTTILRKDTKGNLLLPLPRKLAQRHSLKAGVHVRIRPTAEGAGLEFLTDLLSIDLPVKEIARIRKAAKLQGQTLNEFINDAVLAGIRKA